MTLEIDFETRSAVDLKKRGAYNYFASETTVPLMASYKIDGGPLKRWRPPAACPDDIVAHVAAGGTVTAHNASFERLLWQMVLTPRYGWPAVRLEQFRCTAATAAAMSLPRDLAGVGAALGLTVQKDKAGHALIRKFSMPRKPRKDEPVDAVLFNEPADHPADFERFHDYCDVDVLTEEAADRRMVPLSTDEQELYWIDQRINDRGIRIDRKSARAALALAEKAKRLLDRDMRVATTGAVTACSQVAKLVEWVQAQGVEMTSAAKAEIEELLELEDLPPAVRRAIEIRQEAAKTSVSKLSAFLDRCGDDGRIRGAFLFLAAGTGRWSSLGAQLHNLPRPRKEFGDAHLDTQILFEAIRLGDPDYLKFLYGNVLGRTLWLISDAMRGFIWAEPGHDLLVADYSGIEGAVAAWFADEHWKVRAMFDLIADPSLPDLYRRAAAGIFNTTTEILTKKDPRRQVGKVSELSLQYQGGVGAFRSMARNYSLKIDPVFPPVWEAASEERREKAVKRYEACVQRGDPMTKQVSREAWLAAELVKVGWRATHPAIVKAWSLLEEAIREAIENPGRKVEVLKCTYLVARGFLWCRLPSGRCLAYGTPKLKEQVWAKRRSEDGVWSETSEILARDVAEALERKGQATIEGEAKSAATALGVNSVTKKWERFALYGGLAFENCLSGDTDVLTLRGWKKLPTIAPTDLLWDGVDWVRHDGVVCQGVQHTIDFAGLRLTPDHKVWTNDGWVCAEYADVHAAQAASPNPEFDRAAFRASDGYQVRGRGRTEELVDGPMRLRHLEIVRRFGAPERQNAELRLFETGTIRRSGNHARDVQTRGLRRLEQHARSVRASLAQGLRALRWPWDRGMRAVARLHGILAGYGAVLAEGVDFGAAGQQRRLRPGELRVARSESAVAEHSVQPDDRNAGGTDADLRSRRDDRAECDDVVLPGRRGVAGLTHVRPAGQFPPDRLEPVYDILNAGPRHRFTVRGENGPIIVSNCVQAIARDLLANGIRQAEAAGYPVIAHVHDEIITEMPCRLGDVESFERLICELPAWAEGLPLTASGWRGKRYRKD